MDVIKIIYVTGDIPNDGVQFIPSMDAALRDQIVDGLLAVAATDEGVEAIAPLPAGAVREALTRFAQAVADRSS